MRPNRKTCSKPCDSILRKKGVTIVCVICGKEFSVPPRKKHRTVCSPECACGQKKLKRIVVNCASCGKDLSLPKSSVEKRRLHFCDIVCFNNYRSPSIDLIKEFHALGLKNVEMINRLKVDQGTITRHLRKLGLRSNGLGEPLETRQEGDKILAHCQGCKEWKELTNFCGHKICRRCRYDDEREKWLELVNSDIGIYFQHKLGAAQNRAKKKGMAFDLDVPFLLDIYDLQGNVCGYSKGLMTMEQGKGRGPNACSIDRFDNTLGYLQTNIILCTWKANTAKTDFSLDEILIYMPFFYFQAMQFPWIKNKHTDNVRAIIASMPDAV
jgi:hypothetical protein